MGHKTESLPCAVCGLRDCAHVVVVEREHRKRVMRAERPLCNTHAAQATAAGYAVREV